MAHVVFECMNCINGSVKSTSVPGLSCHGNIIVVFDLQTRARNDDGGGAEGITTVASLLYTLLIMAYSIKCINVRWS